MIKRYLLIAFLTFDFLCSAQAPVPEYMKDGEITVTLTSGETYKFSTNDWKVVNRASSDAAEEEEQAKIVDKQPASEAASTVLASEESSGMMEETFVPHSRMVFSLIPQIGSGQDGVKTTQVPGGYLNEPARGVVFGGTLCVGNSNLFAKFCASAFSNRLYTLGIETEF